MGQLKITLKRSTIGTNERQKNVVKALGLRKINSSVIKEDNASIRGMVNKVSHLVVMEEIQ